MEVLPCGKKRYISHTFVRTNYTRVDKLFLTPTTFVLFVAIIEKKKGKKGKQKLIGHSHMIVYTLTKDPKLEVELMNLFTGPNHTG